MGRAMYELVSIVMYWLRRRYCVLTGHRWMSLNSLTGQRICLRCLLHELGAEHG